VVISVTKVLDVIVDMDMLTVAMAMASGNKGEIFFIVVFFYPIMLTSQKTRFILLGAPVFGPLLQFSYLGFPSSDLGH
jgi:hypothetical protein